MGRQASLILIKQNLDLNPTAKNNVANNVIITISSTQPVLKKDFILERTKEGLHVCAANGITLEKAKKVIEASIYDKDKEKFLTFIN